VVWGPFLDRLPSPHGPSARSPRTVRLGLRRLPKSLLPVLHFRVALSWGLFLGLVGLL
jgi:hypothetical protein